MSAKQIEAVYRLTPMQEGMLYHSLMNKQAGTDLVQMQTTISGYLDTSIFAESVNRIVERYTTFRTIFLYEKLDEAKQVVLKQRKCNIEVEDIHELSDEDKQKVIHQYLESDRKKKMDLSKDMLLRVHIFKTEPEEYQVIYTFHHIILDGWSVGIIMRELYHIYDCLLMNKSIDLKEACNMEQYVQWLEKQNSRSESLFYWKQLLKGYEEAVDIPKSWNTKIDNSFLRRDVEFCLDEEMMVRMTEFCKEKHITLSTLVHTICGVLVQKYMDCNDVVFGTVVSGRNAMLQDVEQIVGLLINTIPFRLKSASDDTFLDLAFSAQKQMLESEKHSYLQLAEVQSMSQLRGDLIRFVIAFENYYSNQDTCVDRDYRILKSIAYEQTNYDINIVFIPGDKLKIKTTYNALVYEKQFIEEIGEHFANIVRRILENPTVPLREIDILSPLERDKILYKYNETKYPYSEEKLLHQLFEDQAERIPNQIAVTCGEREMSYGLLNKKANQLAHCLRLLLKNTNEPIGILMDRGVELVEGIVGVLKANAVYVPFENSHPVLRIVKEIEELAIEKILVTSNQLDLLNKIMLYTESIKYVYVLDDSIEKYQDLKKENVSYIDKNIIEKYSDQNLNNLIDSASRAYIIYTSGSTGVPKGVAVQHKPVVNVIEFLSREYEIGEKDRILFLTSICFDLSVYDIWGMLAVGGSIEVVPTEKMSNHHYIMKRLCSGDITIWDSAPSVLQQLIPLFGAYEIESKSRLRRVLVGGDWVDLKLSREMKRISKEVKVTALGGATEATIYSNYYNISEVDSRWISIPYGKPIQNAKYYVLNSELEPMPVGVKGDLYIGGECLAEGYINDEQLSKNKFINNPFDNNASIMYKTGDSARWFYDGNMEFLGRNDYQVKIRGFRIEIGEIEYHLKNYEGVKDVIVLVHGKSEEERVLIAYYIADKEISSADFVNYLRQYIPEYMIPTKYMALQEFPLNANGKIDRKELPQPMLPYRNIISFPENEMQEKIREVWADILNISQDRISIDDIFSEIGGHSLLVIRMEVELRKRKILTAQKDDIIQLGNYCTIRNVANLINEYNQVEGA